MDRRSFLKIGALAASSGAIGACGQVTQKVIPYVTEPDDGINPVDGYWYATTCRECRAGCGAHVRTVNGRAKKMEGNPDHPISGGKLCAKGQAAVQRVYHPERLTTPLLKSGGTFAPVDWAKAISTLSGKLKSSGGNIFYINNGSNDHTAGIAEAIFGKKDGYKSATNHDPGQESHFEAAATLGEYPKISVPDMGNATFSLLLGADIFESDRSPVYYSRAFGESRRGKPSARGRMVYIGSRMSITGAACDKWIPAPPGSLGSIVLSIAHVVVEGVIERNLAKAIPRNAVARWSDALADYNPEKIGHEVEIEPDIIRRLARPFLEEAPAIAIAGDDMAGYTNGVSGLRAVEFLNMVSYEIGREKLHVEPRRMPETDPDLKERMLNAFGVAPQEQTYGRLAKLTSDMAGGKFRVGIVSHTNPVFDTPAALKFKEAFAKTPFKVAFANFMDETAAECDLILPDHHWLESWSAQMPNFIPGVPLLNLQQPVIRPFYDTKAEADVLIEAAAGAGYDKPAKNGEEYIKKIITKFRAEMFQIPPVMDDNEAWQFLLRKGGSWPEETTIEQDEKPSSKKLWALKDTLKAEEPEFMGGGEKFPFHLHLYQTVHMGRGAGANHGWMQEAPDPITTLMWQSWIEISENTAEKMGIHEGDMITVTSAHGSITGPAFPYVGLRPDVIAVPLGYGHTNYGKNADGRGANPMTLLGDVQDSNSGAVAWRSQMVTVAKATGSFEMLRKGSKEGERHGEVFQL